VSWSKISRLALAKTNPVKPPNVNKKINPKTQKRRGETVILLPYRVESQLNTLIPVGTAIIIVALVK